MDKEEYTILGDLINKDLQLDAEDALVSSEDMPDMNIFHKKLSILIAYLMENDMHRLLNAMYRLDVSEARFHEAMQRLSKEEVASHIADLILERELQKVKTRLHYKKHRKF